MLGEAVDPTDQNERRLAILKALGDDTRFLVFQGISRSSVALTTSQVAEMLGLHVNTVRPHLERMRDVGLLSVDTGPRGEIGRPQHRYSVAPGAPRIGFGESAYAALARGLLMAMIDADVDGEALFEAGRAIGREGASRTPPNMGVLAALMSEQNRQGFDPYPAEQGDDGSPARVVRFRCPFPDLAAANPELVCGFHRGMVDGLLEQRSGGAVTSTFSTVVDDPPCQVELVAR